MSMLNSSLKRIIYCTALLMLLSACTHRHSPVHPQGTSFDSNPLPVTENLTELKISEILGKSIIEFPIDPKVQTYADYDAQENIIIFFTPATFDFSLPTNETSLIRNVEKQYLDDKIQSLTLTLNAKAKFLLSKQDDGRAKLTLVPDTTFETTASLPDNFISGINFRSENDALLIVLHSSLPFEIIPEQNPQFKLSFENAQFEDKLLKKYDVSKLDTTVLSVVAKNDGSKHASLEFSGPKNPPLSIQRRGDETLITVRAEHGALPATQSIAANRPSKEAVGTGDDEDDDFEMHELNILFPGMKETYTGENISIDLQDADLEHVLRLISEISGYNLIFDDDVSGRISLKLVDIPWDQALDLILLQKNLGMVMKGNIMRIASATRLEDERAKLQKAREAAIQAKESIETLAPLKTEYIQINYNTASDFEGKVKSFLTNRGKVTADSRTNILIVTDTESTLRRVKSFISKLDRAERQVLIEARLVYATDEFQRNLGINWGAAYDRPGEQISGGIAAEGLHMLPQVNSATLTGEIGKYLGKDLFSLDASLQLGESKNLVKTISSPRILTLNNNRAEIQQGTKIATASESSSGGTTTEYEDAVLKISVLPQITPDDKLILDLEISDDSPKADNRDIDTKQTKTKMMVSDRETIVIGGVQKASETSGVNQIPGLGNIPGLGWLFKHDYKSKNKAELLIFIHPRIL